MILPEQIDLIFPYFVFAYGALLTFVLNMPVLMRIAEERMAPEMLGPMKAHRGLALICLVVGGLWSLQNLWISG